MTAGGSRLARRLYWMPLECVVVASNVANDGGLRAACRSLLARWPCDLLPASIYTVCEESKLLRHARKLSVHTRWNYACISVAMEADLSLVSSTMVGAPCSSHSPSHPSELCAVRAWHHFSSD